MRLDKASRKARHRTVRRAREARDRRRMQGTFAADGRHHRPKGAAVATGGRRSPSRRPRSPTQNAPATPEPEAALVVCFESPAALVVDKACSRQQTAPLRGGERGIARQRARRSPPRARGDRLRPARAWSRPPPRPRHLGSRGGRAHEGRLRRAARRAPRRKARQEVRPRLRGRRPRRRGHDRASAREPPEGSAACDGVHSPTRRDALRAARGRRRGTACSGRGARRMYSSRRQPRALSGIRFACTSHRLGTRSSAMRCTSSTGDDGRRRGTRLHASYVAFPKGEGDVPRFNVESAVPVEMSGLR